MERYKFDKMLYGVHIGEHGFSKENVIDEIRTRVIEPGYNFVTIRTRARKGEIIEREVYYEWAKYLKENKIYFLFLYTMKTGEKLVTSFDAETIKGIKEIAGEYFLGDMVGELGSCFGAKHKGYSGNNNPYIVPRQDHPDLEAAANAFVDVVGEYTAIDRALGMPYISSVEPTALSKYIDMGGVDLPMVELMCADPDILLPYMRGMARAFGRTWGSYMAHEWYGGFFHDDILKRKRLFIGGKLAYLYGSSVFCIESGDEVVTAYGDRFEVDSEVCSDYRRMLDEIKALADDDKRHKGGPRVKLAFVSGRYDAFAGWGGSSAFGQYDRPEWGHKEAEHSYRLLTELSQKRKWSDIENYGESDLSATPAYGQYDIVPIEADLEALSRYDYIIFLGWHSMKNEDIDKLIAYVKGGGRLLMTAAHLNCSVKRDGEYILPSKEKLHELFGITTGGETISTNAGLKFIRRREDGEPIYPGALPNMCDPILTTGYNDYLVVECDGATTVGELSDGFTRKTMEYPPAVVENRLGDGVATLVTALHYPGDPVTYPIYRALVRELVTLSHRNAKLKVISSDRLRYSVYEDGRVYLLNTDYDLPICAKLVTKNGEELVSLEPLEIKSVKLDI